MRLPSLFLLCGIIASVAAVPAPTPAPTPPPSLKNRSPNDNVSIAPVSIAPVSIPPVSIAPISIKEASTSTCIGAVKPDKNGYVPADQCNALWNYNVNFGAAVFFSILFIGTMVAHITQAIMKKTGYCWVIIMGASWESISYVTRSAAAKNQQSSGLATISQLFVLVAPIWVNAFDYMVFARMVHVFSPTKKVWKVSPSILSFIFVSLDLFSFMIQIVGGFMASPGNSASAMQNGVHVYMVGIGIQEAFIFIFTGLIVKYHLDMLKAERSGITRAGWKILLYALYGSLIAITVRIIFRLIEFSKGFGDNNTIPRKESLFYIFEAIPMFTAILIWNIFHPGRSLTGPDAKLPTSWLSRKLCCCCHRKGKKDKKGGHERLATSENEEELKGLRSRDVSADRGRMDSRTGEPFDYTYSNSREPSPLPHPQPAGYAPYRDPSPYRQQEFLGPPQYEQGRV